MSGIARAVTMAMDTAAGIDTDKAARIIQKAMVKGRYIAKKLRSKRAKTYAKKFKKLAKTVQRMREPAAILSQGTQADLLYGNLYYYRVGSNIDLGEKINDRKGRVINLKAFRWHMCVTPGDEPATIHCALMQAKTYPADKEGGRMFLNPNNALNDDYKDLGALGYGAGTAEYLRPLARDDWKVIDRFDINMSSFNVGNDNNHLVTKYYKLNRKLIYETEDAVAPEYTIFPRIYMFWWVSKAYETEEDLNSGIYCQVNGFEYFDP